MIDVLWLALGLLAYLLAPALVVMLMPMPWRAKRGAALSVLDAAWRELVRLPFNVLAPIAVAVLIACRQLRWEYERVGDKDGWLDALWGNNVRFQRSDGVFVGGVNGDELIWRENAAGVGEPERFPLSKDKASADYAQGVALNYWCKGRHGRENLSRWVWLGCRNRASRLAQLLARSLNAKDYDEIYGDPMADIGQPGWFAARIGRAWQVHACIRVPGIGRVWRFNAGFKLRSVLQYGGRAHASNLLFSLRKPKKGEGA